MRKKNYKGRVTKRYLPKCNDIADTVQKVSYKIINMLAESEDSAFTNLRESED